MNDKSHHERSDQPRAFYICGTHWDREWYEPFQEFRMWLVQNLDDTIDRLKADAGHRVFHLDGQAVVLEDFLEIRPERREEISSLLRDGRLVAGPWYAMPDLWLVSGESLIRNFTLGMGVVRGLGAEPMKIGYCPDLFGHIASMPMIFNGLGFQGAVVWRGLNDEQVPAQFLWVGPDGSAIPTHRFPDNYGYGWFGGQIRHRWRDARFDRDVLLALVPGVMQEERERGRVPLMFLGDGGDHQNMPEKVPEMLGIMAEACPEIHFIQGTMSEYFEELATCVDKLPQFSGELRYAARATGKWYHALIPHCLSSRYPLKQANDRCQNRLSFRAEPLAAYAMAEGKAIPSGYLELAWKYLLRNQPHDSIGGCSVDETHADMPYRFHQADLLAGGVMRQAIARLVEVSAKADDVSHVTIWNPLPWMRSEVCELEIVFPRDYPAKGMRTGHQGPVVNQFRIVDAEGRTLRHQLLETKSGRTIKRTGETGRRTLVGTGMDVYRVAVELTLPPAGPTGFDVVPLEGDGAVNRLVDSLRTGPLSAANQDIEIRIAPDGGVELEHFESGRIYTDLFQYEDTGDTGDGWNFVPPLRNSTYVGKGHSVGVSIEEDGPLRVTFRIDRILRVPASLEPVDRESRVSGLVDLPISDFLTICAGDSLLHVKTVVNNTPRDHRLRVLFPCDMAVDRYWSDQPFAWVGRAIATDPGSAFYKEPDVPERPHHTAFAVCDGGRGLALLCPEGLHEHSILDDRRRTLALTLFRGVHKTVQTDGEEGAQTLGSMDFRYALFPFAGPLPKGRITRRVTELQAGVFSHLSPDTCPARSLISLEAGEDVVVTAVKPGIDGSSVVLRLWNTGEEEQAAVVLTKNTVASAWLCNLNEEPTRELCHNVSRVPLQVAPAALATLKLSFDVL